MSVIRQPELLGRTGRRRLVGMTASVATAGLESVSVCTWLFLVAFGARTAAFALAGLGVLLCGCLLRAGIFGAAIGDRDPLVRPFRIGLAVFLTAGWICWLLVAERVGGVAGVVLAGLVLSTVLAVEFTLEGRAFGVGRRSSEPAASLLSAGLLVVGASALLASVRFSDWAVSSPLALEATTVAVRLEAAHLGAVIFGLFAFLAHQRRFQRRLDP